MAWEDIKMVKFAEKHPKQRSQSRKHTYLTISFMLLGLGSLSTSAIAEEVATAPNQSQPRNLQQLQAALMDLAQIPQVQQPRTVANTNGIQSLNASATPITDESLSVYRATIPSLWWRDIQTSEWVGTDRLVVGWAAHNQGRTSLDHIDVTVNGQVWNLLNYLEQYTIINQFGQTAKAYGYQLRIFNGDVLEGGYTCNFAQINDQDFSLEATLPHEQLDNIPCSISLDYFGQGGIRGSRSRL